MDKNNYILEKTIPAKEAEYSNFPNELNSEIIKYLESQNINKLYTHQVEMFEKANFGDNVVITTSTASGKTLSFLLPVLQRILANPSSRAIFIYPTKALAADQYRAIKPIIDYFGANKVNAGVYDGDTAVNLRSKIRASANIILTNPEMLNGAFLPNHSKYNNNFIFSNLDFVVIDELHSYKGAFGSHLSNVFKRFHRICKYYNSKPQFLCSSATIANPCELAENICHVNFNLVEKDGAPRSEKKFVFIEPPYIGKNKMVKEAISRIAVEMIPEFTEKNDTFIAFCKSRKAVEIILKESREILKNDGEFIKQDLSGKISGYRGGYTPEERKEIERKMVTGEINGLISTNALELGIDIGKVNTCLLIGYPGTRASFWQQSGRAGRNKKASTTYMILDDLPFDQYIGTNPDWLFNEQSESAVIDKDNLYIQLCHIRAAVAELPLTLDDMSYFPNLGEIMPTLLKANEIKMENGRFSWIGKGAPSQDYSLRNMENNRYQLINSETNMVICELDEYQAFRDAHLQSIYMHDSSLFIVTEFHLAERKILLSPIECNYYTEPFGIVNLKIIEGTKSNKLYRTDYHYGDINITKIFEGHKKLQFTNHQNLGYDPLFEPLAKEYDTEAMWFDLPENVAKAFAKDQGEDIEENKDRTAHRTYFEGLGYAMLNSAMMLTMATKDELDFGEIIGKENKRGVCLYDVYMGGLGYSEKLYKMPNKIIENSIQMLKGCKCEKGCPACVGDYKLNKEIVLWALEEFLRDETQTPEIELLEDEVDTRDVKEKPFKFSNLEEKWPEFQKLVKEKGEYLADFINKIEKIKCSDDKVTIFVENDFYKIWAMDLSNINQLKNCLKFYCTGMYNISIDVESLTENSGLGNIKVDKRYSQLKRTGDIK